MNEPFAMMHGLLSQGNRPVTDLAEALTAVAAIFETEKQVHQLEASKAAYAVAVSMSEVARGHIESDEIWFQDEATGYTFQVPI